MNVGATATGLTVTGTTIVIVDNDDRGVTASLAVMTVDEGGTNTYTVVLDTQPTGEVTVRPTVSGDSDVSVRPPAVTFSTGSWSTAQTFTVSAAHDEDAAHDSASISHRASGADYAQVQVEDVTVNGQRQRAGDGRAHVTGVHQRKLEHSAKSHGAIGARRQRRGRHCHLAP